MINEWKEVIGLLTLIQLSFLTVVAYNYKKGRKLSNRLLSGFLASNAILIANWVMFHFHFLSHENLWIIYIIGSSSYLLLMPFLYVYIVSLCYSDFRLTRVHLLHLLPFAVVVFIRTVVHIIASLNPTGAGTLLWGNQPGVYSAMTFRIVLHLQVATYLVLSFRILTRYRKQLKDIYSSIEKIDLSWCNLLLTAFALMWMMDLLNWIFDLLSMVQDSVLQQMFLVSLLINLIFTLAATYRGLIQSRSFSGILDLPKYAASKLKQTECDIIARKLTEYMKAEKPYFLQSLSIEDLAGKLNVPSKHLSQVIHTGLNYNFYDFVNSYRINEAMIRLRDSRYKSQTILSVAYDVGFNSKSVFNAAFKKHVGMTPKEYRNPSPGRMQQN
jgi:AraC-like DNA-binding protein